MKGGVNIFLDVDRKLYTYESAPFQKRWQKIKIKTEGINYEKNIGINFC
jgi:hypothetical protein